jgi:ABC-2 type transport system permease protein
MSGYGAFLRKEALEILRTWRIWVLPGIVLFFALSGPPLMKLTPQLLETLTTEQPGVIIQFPDPTYKEVYLDWISNLAQIVLFAVIIIFGGMISREKKSGTATLVLTKPISRRAFVLAKFTSSLALLTLATVVGTFALWGMTLAVFGEAPGAELWAATALWGVTAVLFLGVMTLLSSWLDSGGAAAGLGIAVFVALSLLGLWGPAVDYTPAGLIGGPVRYLSGEDPMLLWPVLTGVVAAVAAVVAATAVFARREL